MVTKQKQRKPRIPRAKLALTLKVSGASIKSGRIPIQDLLNAGSFFTGWTFDQLARMQAVEPLKDSKELAGGWPEDEDIDDVLQEIYDHRN